MNYFKWSPSFQAQNVAKGWAKCSTELRSTPRGSIVPPKRNSWEVECGGPLDTSDGQKIYFLISIKKYIVSIYKILIYMHIISIYINISLYLFAMDVRVFVRPCNWVVRVDIKKWKTVNWLLIIAMYLKDYIYIDI